MNKDMDAQFLCKDCARYNLCKYYDRRKEDSYICKYFHLSENQNKCGDLISRQAVENITWEEPSYTDPLNVLTEVREKVRALPSVENKGEWIPVSERLPVLRGTYKISDDVLITNGFEIDMGYLVERKGKIFWHYYGSEYEVGIKDEDNDATAWMPLPEPYKKGGE